MDSRDAVGRAAPVLVAMVASISACTSTENITGLTYEAGDFLQQVVVDGAERQYIVHVPPGLSADDPVPVLVILHGAGLLAAEQQIIAAADPLADERGFVTVYPQGASLDWTFLQGLPDDRKFMRLMLNQMEEGLNIDRERIYALGFSNGGLMAFRLGCQETELFRAIGTVAATLIRSLDNICPLSEPVPAVFILGTADRVFLYDDGLAGGRSFYGGLATTARWAALNGCSGDPVPEALPDRFDDGTTVTHWRTTGCPPGGDVELYAVEEGGHTWPGSPVDLDPALGLKSLDIEATRAAVDFFLRF